MGIAMILIFGAAVIGLGSWLVSKLLHRSWYVNVTIPRIARREAANLDREYRALVRKGRHQRPNRDG
jgi:uncharacterized membrane protein SirB2